MADYRCKKQSAGYLQFTEETAELIDNRIMKVINNFDFKNKIISFSADYTNTNFGEIQRKGKNNAFTKLKKNH